MPWTLSNARFLRQHGQLRHRRLANGLPNLRGRVQAVPDVGQRSAFNRCYVAFIEMPLTPSPTCNLFNQRRVNGPPLPSHRIFQRW